MKKLLAKLFASISMFVVVLAASLFVATPAQAGYNYCRSYGFCMWLYPNWMGPGENGWQWDALWIANRPGGILKFGSNQWNNYTAGWYNNSGFIVRLYLDANCTGTRYLYIGPYGLTFASPESGGFNNDFYRSASCVKVVQS